MATQITLSEIQDAETTNLVKLFVDHLHYINSRILEALQDTSTSRYVNDNTLLIHSLFPQSNNGEQCRADAASLSVVVSALQSDSHNLSIFMGRKILSQFKFYQKSYGSTSRKFKIYPEKINIIGMEASLAESFSNLNGTIDKLKKNSLPSANELRKLNSDIDAVYDVYNKHMKALWSEIEKLDKFRNDHGRFAYARITFYISIVLILIGQSKDIYENLKWIWQLLFP